MKKNSYSCFQNRDCKYFPCHKDVGEDFNCLFCYCPLYTLGERCGGRFTYTDSGIKDCSDCILPHTAKGYRYVLSRFKDVAALAKENRTAKEG